MATCEVCNRSMPKSAGCTLTHVLMRPKAVCPPPRDAVPDATSMSPEEWGEAYNAARVVDTTIEPRLVERIKVGRSGNDVLDLEGRCCDCAAKDGHHHHPGCDREVCPGCGGQAIGCDLCDVAPMSATITLRRAGDSKRRTRIVQGWTEEEIRSEGDEWARSEDVKGLDAYIAKTYALLEQAEERGNRELAGTIENHIASAEAKVATLRREQVTA